VADFIVSDQLPLIAAQWLRDADPRDDDPSRDGVFHPDCLKLSELHSIAVDFPKTGRPIDLTQIPRPKSWYKPDWSKDELGGDEREYYPSQRALGHLFRAVKMPAVEVADEEGRNQRQATARQSSWRLTLDWAVAALNKDASSDGNLLAAVLREHILNQCPQLSEHVTHNDLRPIVQLFNKYRTEFSVVCRENTLGTSHRVQLTEEEAVAGTIVAKAHFKKRNDTIIRLNEQTAQLLDSVRDDLGGGEGSSHKEWARRAWLAWRLSCAGDEVGWRSFGWIALGSLFDAFDALAKSSQTLQ